MRRLLACFLVVAIAGPACGQAPPATPTVTLPVMPVPAPNPTNPTVLGANQLYVVQATGPVVVLTSPQGILKVTPAVGPMTIRGQFVDGTGVETRAFKAADLYLVEASAEGTAELLIVPSMDAKAVIRQTLTTQPLPPVPPPVPPTPPDSNVAAMTAALKADGQPLTVAATLAGVYRNVAKSTVNNTALNTYADLFGSVAVLQDAVVDKTKIPKLRTLIGQQLMQGLGSPVPATAIDRALAAKTFDAVAASLEGVK